MDRDPPHYLKPLKTTTVPKRLLWLDCQPQTERHGGATVDSWSTAVLGQTWYTSKKGDRRDNLLGYQDPALLWANAAAFCQPGKRAVLFAHDLAYQLRISQALVHLPAEGFHLDRIVLERTAAWALFRKQKQSLMCCDIKSWIPAWQPGVDTATGRVTELRKAVLEILDWIEAEQLGPFRPTGSGQSYSAYRRRFLKHKLLVHDNHERLHLERTAMWTGRCEAWRHGKQTGGPFVEYDLQAAYLNIAAECEVPTIAWRMLKRPKIPRLLELTKRYAVMAEVEIQTEVPIAPARLGDRTLWPVGRFRTVLWDPELKLAADYADQITCSRAWLYHRTPALQEFARWTLDVMAGSMVQYGPLPARVAKHWSRCLVGRLGLRFRGWERFGTQPDNQLELLTYLDLDAGTSTDLLIAGHDVLILTELTEARDSLPQIPGWVMSECRRRLWDRMVSFGLDHVLYVDTDSIIVGKGAVYPAALGSTHATAAGWASEGRYSALTIHGPRNLSMETGRRVSGLPLTARQTAPLEFTGEVMRSIKESMRSGELDHVASIPRKFVLDAPDLRRQHHPDGSTIPYRIYPPKEL